jgi:hypothetical protein
VRRLVSLERVISPTEPELLRFMGQRSVERFTEWRGKKPRSELRTRPKQVVEDATTASPGWTRCGRQVSDYKLARLAWHHDRAVSVT